MKLILPAIIALSLVPAIALADDAQEHVDRATHAYNVQDWSTALAEYKRAYELDPKPETLWAIAQTQRLSGDCRSAILTYRAYSRGASAAGANAADQWIKQCEATIEAQRKAIEEAPPPAPVKPAPAVTPPAPGPAPVVGVHAEPDDRRSAALDPLGDTLAVVALAGLAGGGYFLVTGNSDMSATVHKPTYQQYDKAVDDARAKQNIGTYALIGGAVFAGLATWRFLAVSSRDREHAQALAPSIVPGGAMVTYGGTF